MSGRPWAALLAVLLAGAGAPVAAAAAPPAATAAGAGALPATLNPSAAFVLAQEVVVLVPQGPAVRVDELLQGVNRSSGPVHGLSFALPPGAIGVSAQGGAPAAAVSVSGGAALVSGTLAPGQAVEYAFTFTVSFAGGSVWLPVAYPTAQFTVLLPPGAWWLSGPGFRRDGTATLKGNVRMDAFTTLAPTPGAVLPLRLARVPLPARRPVWITAAALAALALAATILRAARRRRAGRVRAEADLIDAVARLDLAHRHGELAEEDYLERRRGLLEELEGIGP